MVNINKAAAVQESLDLGGDFNELEYRDKLIEAGLSFEEAATLAAKTASHRSSAQTHKQPSRSTRAHKHSKPSEKLEAIAAAQRQKIEALARPGETYEQAQRRHIEESDKAAKESSSMRVPPLSDAQADFFVPTLYDVATKDSSSVMDVAVFRLSKRDKRANTTVRYDRPDGYVEVVSGEAGMASIWDYDIVLMAISHLTDAMNLYRQGRGDKPTRFFRPQVSEILKFCRRSDGGRQYEEIEAALKRLSTTFVEVVTTTTSKNKRATRTAKGVGLISSYETVSYADNGRLTSVSIELPQWLYDQIVESKKPAVLTVHPEYFLIEPGVGRYLYRLARKSAGSKDAVWSFQLIYERSGSTGSFKEFCRILRRLIQANDLPEYTLKELSGKAGPLLKMTHRNYTAQEGTEEREDFPDDSDGPEE